MNTNDRILAAALFLFNRFGFVNVRLQHIADETGLSVGNLNYHFTTKNAIIDTLYQQITAQQRQLLSDLSVAPIFVNLNRFFGNTFLLQQQYSFFYTDTLELMRAYPAIRQAHREHLHWQLKQLENWYMFNVERGALQAPVIPDTIQRFAYRLLMLLETKRTFAVSLSPQGNKLQGDEYVSDLWAFLSGHFTLAGQDEYRHLTISTFKEE